MDRYLIVFFRVLFTMMVFLLCNFLIFRCELFGMENIERILGLRVFCREFVFFYFRLCFNLERKMVSLVVIRLGIIFVEFFRGDDFIVFGRCLFILFVRGMFMVFI